MIIFKSVTYRNLLSSGNKDITVHLDKCPLLLIQGANGSGKSTVIEAITFCLFGKSFRKINKPQLINQSNKKDLHTKVEFSIGTNEYVVERGIKPNLFEITMNGSPLPQDAALKDTQRQLEEQILRMNFRSFSQVVILGSATFVPFMQLVPADRRVVVESILDLRNFGVMFALVKDRISGIKAEVARLKSEGLNASERVTAQRTLIGYMRQSTTDHIEALHSDILDKTAILGRLANQYQEVADEIEEKTSQLISDACLREVAELEKIEDRLTDRLRRISADTEFYNENSICDSCHQSIDDTFKLNRITKNNAELAKLGEGVVQLRSKKAEAQKTVQELKEAQEEIRQLQLKSSSISAEHRSVECQRNQIQAQIEKAQAACSDVKLEEGKLEGMLLRQEELKVECEEAETRQREHEVVYKILKDDGVKSVIVNQYIPVFNELIKIFLSEFNLPLEFSLDPTFIERVLSPMYQDYSYSSFSEGEKQRIDLAVLLALREVCRLKASVTTNLLFFDEVFDSSLDADGSAEVLRVLKSVITDTNIVVISHTIEEQLQDHFDEVLTFRKTGGFSVLN